MKFNIEPVGGRSRIFEDSNENYAYADSLESGDSEYDLDYEYSDEESDNDNTITQNEKNWSQNGINIGNWMKIRKNILEIRKEYRMILFILIFNKLIKLKKEKIKKII
jgi:hypothetical protein